MTPSEEKTQEERARARAIADARTNFGHLLNKDATSAEPMNWRYSYCLEIEQLRLTNQRLTAEIAEHAKNCGTPFQEGLYVARIEQLEAEVERMKSALEKCWEHTTLDYEEGYCGLCLVTEDEKGRIKHKEDCIIAHLRDLESQKGSK